MYTNTAKFLHWLVAGAIILQYVLAEMAEEAADQGAALQQLALLAHHKSVGMTILLLATFRVLWRFVSPPPELPEQMPHWQVIASNVSHALLYGLLFALPITGWLMSSASAYSVSWFNLFTLPDLVHADESLKDTLISLHHLCAEALFILAVIHIAAAIKHAVFDRDGVLARMSSIASIAAGGVVLVSGLYLLQPEEAPATQTAAPSGTRVSAELDTVESTISPWEIDYAESSIKFIGEQAGASFEGHWLDWSADIRFDPNALEDSAASVVIQTGSVDSQDSERDSMIVGTDWFDSANFPTATFTADEFSNSGEHFQTIGYLSVRSINLPLEFAFEIEETAKQIRLIGSATIDRSAHEIGTGEWSDTTWVGQFVKVEVVVIAQSSTNK